MYLVISPSRRTCSSASPSSPASTEGGHRLAGARRTDQEELAPRCKALLNDAPGMALLADHAFYLLLESVAQDHFTEPGFRVRSLQKA